MVTTILKLVVNIIVNIFIQPSVPVTLRPCLPVVILTTLSTLLNTTQTCFRHDFSSGIFIVSFFSGIVATALLIFLNGRLNINSRLRATIVIILNVQVFAGISSVQHFVFGK